MNSLNNHFHIYDSNRNIVAERREFTIESGLIRPLGGRYLVNQFVRIIGSIMNDGVYRVESVGDGYIDVSINDAAYPTWVAPTGAVDAYPIGARVTHNGIRYASLINANTTVPGEGRYWEVVGEAEHRVIDEDFDGIVAPLRIPPDFLELNRSIQSYVDAVEKDPAQAMKIAESIGTYSYTKATGKNGLPPTWQEVFMTSLTPYRRMFAESTAIMIGTVKGVGTHEFFKVKRS